MEWDIQTVCLIAIASCTVIMTLIAIVVMARLFTTLKKVEDVASEIREKATETSRGFGHVTQLLHTGLEFYELWKERKTK